MFHFFLNCCKRKKKEGVYVLNLEGGKYYVGESNDISRRIWMHEHLKGSAWTKKHKVLGEQKTISQRQHHFWELVETLEQMHQHGIDNVRGSIFTNPNTLSVNDKVMAAQLYCELKNYCRRCGNYGHYIGSCNSKNKAPWVSKFGNKLEWVLGDFQRSCLQCKKDISKSPKYHKFCLSCFRSQSEKSIVK